MSSAVAYTAQLLVDRAAVEWFSRSLAPHRRRIGTRKGTRRLTPWSQAMLVLRWLIDATRIAQLRRDNGLPLSTTYDYLWEGLEVLAASAPSLAEAFDTASAAGSEHIGLDGTLIPTNRVRVEGPTAGCDLFYSGKHRRHGVNLQVISAPNGYPLWIGDARPGRENDSTAAHHTGVEEAIALLNIGIPEEAHLLGPGRYRQREVPRLPRGPLRPQETQARESDRRPAPVQPGPRCAARSGREANADLKMRFRCFQKIGLNPWRIGTIERPRAIAIIRKNRQPKPLLL